MSSIHHGVVLFCLWILRSSRRSCKTSAETSVAFTSCWSFFTCSSNEFRRFSCSRRADCTHPVSPVSALWATDIACTIHHQTRSPTFFHPFIACNFWCAFEFEDAKKLRMLLPDLVHTMTWFLRFAMVMMFTKMRMNHFEGIYFNFFQMTCKKYKMQFIGKYIIYNLFK